MSKFDKYFKIDCSSAAPTMEMNFNYPIKVYNKNYDEYMLYSVIKTMYGNNSQTQFILSNGKMNWITTNENDILLEEELFFLKTKIGQLLYG